MSAQIQRSDDPPKLPGFKAWFGRTWMAFFGWRVDAARPEGITKAVVVAAPHTSNWDLTFTLGVSYVLGIKISWIGKHTLFKPPLGWLLKFLGGVPVNRSGRHNAVAAAVELLQKSGPLMLVVPPEGTRSKATRWKTGFYYIAVGAKVPIILGYVDYARKLAGIGKVFYPSGDIEKDFGLIREFYADMKGKFPDRAGEITVAPPEKDAAVASLSSPD